MSKVVTSPIEEWPGTVTFSDPLTLAQVVLYEDAVWAARQLLPGKGSPLAAAEEIAAGGFRLQQSQLDLAFIEGLLACVETFDLANFPTVEVTVENFPGTPRDPSMNLIAWLMDELRLIYKPVVEIKKD